MGVRRAPWWLTWLLTGGLVAIFVGERILGSAGAGRLLLSLSGAVVVALCLGWRLLAWRAADGEARRVEGMLLMAYAGCTLALVGYLVSSDWGMRRFGFEFDDPLTRTRYVGVLRVLWPILLAVSLIPALAAQVALAAHRHAPTGASGIEAFRIREVATGGLTVALAGALLFVLGFITSQRDRTVDVSYFRTSAPGTATEGIVSTLDEPLRVILFFPAVNPVKDEVTRYFQQLRSSTGRVQIEEHDRLASPRLAEQYSVTDDGTVVLAHGELSERIEVGAEMNGARRHLRTLDRTVQRALLPLVREVRTAYLTTGHGELNDPRTARVFAGTPLGEVEALREILQYLNYDVRDIGLTSGLGFDVPDDAAMVLVVGPQRPFHETEISALQRYMDRGGAVLLALDPESEFDTRPFERQLGVRYVAAPLVDDEQHLRQRGDLSDRRLIITDRFSSHEVMTTVGRAGVGAGLLVVAPGYLEPVEGAGVSPAFVLRSAPTTFDDTDRNYEFTEGAETRRSYELAAAVEAAPENDSAAGEGSAAGGTPRRALVFASSALLSDGVITSLGLNAALVADGLRWLGGEEAFAGSTETEEDVPIMHTRSENVAWFYATIFGAPGLVLALGLAGVYRYRRERRGE